MCNYFREQRCRKSYFDRQAAPRYHPTMPNERPLESSDDWQRFLRERKRAEYAISNWDVAKFVLIWSVGMLIAHLRGLF
jgi:hypothetical protein